MSHMPRRASAEVMASRMPWPICPKHGKRYKVCAEIRCSIAIYEQELAEAKDPKRQAFLKARIAKKMASLKNLI